MPDDDPPRAIGLSFRRSRDGAGEARTWAPAAHSTVRVGSRSSRVPIAKPTERAIDVNHPRPGPDRDPSSLELMPRLA